MLYVFTLYSVRKILKPLKIVVQLLIIRYMAMTIILDSVLNLILQESREMHC